MLSGTARTLAISGTMTSSPEITTMIPAVKMTTITSTMKRSSNSLTGIEFLYADKYCVALHKEPGIPCQTRSNHPPHPLDESLPKYLNESVRIWTRIDQPVSGIVLFYREKPDHPPVTHSILDKSYLCLVEGHPSDTGENDSPIVSYIRRDGKKKKAVEDQNHGQRAELSYTILKKFDRYTLLYIKPITGRYHQIRFQMAHLGHPVKGDVKYGARRKNPDRSIHLHAIEYTIQHNNDPPIKIVDGSLPDDPLWNLSREHTKHRWTGSSNDYILNISNNQIT